jgi:hypothetical protein
MELRNTIMVLALRTTVRLAWAIHAFADVLQPLVAQLYADAA